MPLDSSSVEVSRCTGSRRMVPAELFGGHTHSSTSGAVVHIWQRNDKFIARGRWQGKAYGKTLGSSEVTASAELRQLLTELDHGSFARPSEAHNSAFRTSPVPKLSLRSFAMILLRKNDELVAEIRP